MQNALYLNCRCFRKRCVVSCVLISLLSNSVLIALIASALFLYFKYEVPFHDTNERAVVVESEKDAAKPVESYSDPIDPVIEPIEALAAMITEGDLGRMESIIPPEQLERMLGCDSITGLRTIIGSIGGAISFKGLSVIHCSASVSYKVLGRNALRIDEIEKLKERFASLGYTELPQDAELIEIEASVSCGGWSRKIKAAPTMVMIGGRWYIDISELLPGFDQTS